MILNFLKCRRNFTFYNIYKIILSCTVIASSIVVVWKFNDECFHIPFPPNSRSKKCIEGSNRNLPTQNNLEVSYKDAVASDLEGIHGKSYSQRLTRRLRTVREKIRTHKHLVSDDDGAFSTTDESQKPIPEKVPEIPEIFINRTKQSHKACSAYIYDEESINFNTDDSAEFLKEMKKLERLEKGENKIFTKTNPLKRNRWIFYNHRQKGSKMKIQWCPIYKSASTSWMAIFTKLVGALTDITTEKIHRGKITFVDLAKNFRLFYPMTQRGAVKGEIPTYSMVVVRHPFKRILSAYQDKLERVKGREYFHRMYGKKIVKYFREDKNPRPVPQDKVPEWQTIVSALTMKSKTKNSQLSQTVPNGQSSIDPPTFIDSKSKGRRSPAPHLSSNALLSDKAIKREEIKRMLAHKHDIPTFREFCSYLVTVDPKDMNEHWRPQYLDCSPCHHKFDLLLKVETLETDKEAVFKILGYDNSTDEAYLEMERTWKQWSNTSNKVNNETFYFSQLNQELIQSLYDIYELDFELFGYSAKTYFNMVK